ncbi:MAG: hypothetical protein JO234_03260 [Hyphomicrobiales bacterium]|nr:hypothetical protein [Hyphomicrobiales bacterium]
MVALLFGGARGDLALDGNGDLRYGLRIDANGKDVKGATGPKLAVLKIVDDTYRWELTPDGAAFILENLSGAYNAFQARFLTKRADEPKTREG